MVSPKDPPNKARDQTPESTEAAGKSSGEQAELASLIKKIVAEWSVQLAGKGLDLQQAPLTPGERSLDSVIETAGRWLDSGNSVYDQVLQEILEKYRAEGRISLSTLQDLSKWKLAVPQLSDTSTTTKGPSPMGAIDDIAITPEQWLREDKRPPGYMPTTDLMLQAQERGVRLGEVLGEDVRLEWKKLLRKAKKQGITDAEGKRIAELSRIIIRKLRKALA